MPRITLVRGDITEQNVDAIVNAANTSLMGGGGVDGAIHRVGGASIKEECQRIRATRYPDGLPTGEAVATTAGDLPAHWVVHTVGPIYDEVEEPEALLRACYSSCLRVADELGAMSIAFPAISAGAYGYPLDEAASIAIESVRDATTSVDDVRFVLFNDAAYAAFEWALERAEISA